MKEVKCTYKQEVYSVRENGQVFRHARGNKPIRLYDNQWTFGKLNKHGYLEIASISVHRIVATAFIGEPPSKEHVVDHIDTNKQNNRPENLRWVTRLENILLNPITVKRIELVCSCNIEQFLADPLKFRDRFKEPNYQWMSSVSKQEAHYSLARMLSWARSDKKSSGVTLGEWIFNRNTLLNVNTETISDIPSITVNALQRNWQIPSEFPCCPQKCDEPISEYAKNIKIGLIFCKNNFYTSIVYKYTISEDLQSMYLITESTKGANTIKPWSLAKIIYENDLFVHISLGNFFTVQGAEKQYYREQGLEWNGEESMDDFM